MQPLWHITLLGVEKEFSPLGAAAPARGRDRSARPSLWRRWATHGGDPRLRV